MTITKIYNVVWLFLAAVAALLFLTGNFYSPGGLIWAFAAATHAGIGFLAVFPAVMTERHAHAYRARKEQTVKKR